jgi:hypothetical protein
VRTRRSLGSGEPPPPPLHPVQTQLTRATRLAATAARRPRVQIPQLSIPATCPGDGFHEGLRSDRAGDVSFLDRATGLLPFFEGMVLDESDPQDPDPFAVRVLLQQEGGQSEGAQGPRARTEGWISPRS